MTHSFEIEDATEYGVQEAIVLYNLRHWVCYNKANRLNIHDGRVWTYNSARALAELFPYFSADMIRRYLDKLEASGVIVTGNYNHRPGDRTKWYSVAGEDGVAPEAEDPDQVAKMPDHLANSPKHLAKMPDPIGKFAAPLPDINTNINSDVNTDTARGLDRLSEHIEQYSKKVCRVDKIALDYKINQASAKVSIETLEQCLQGVLQAADDPTYPADKLPRSLSALLGDVERIDSWARRYTAKQPKSAQNWWSGLSEEAIIDRITSLLRYRIEVPQEVKKWIPQAQQRLNERLAV